MLRMTPGLWHTNCLGNISFLSLGPWSSESFTSVAGGIQKPISKLKSFLKEQRCISYDPNFTKFSYFKVKNCGVFQIFIQKHLVSSQKHKWEKTQPFHQGFVPMVNTDFVCLISFVKLLRLQQVIQALPFPARVNAGGIKCPVNGEYLNVSIHESEFHPVIPPTLYWRNKRITTFSSRSCSPNSMLTSPKSSNYFLGLPTFVQLSINSYNCI